MVLETIEHDHAKPWSELFAEFDQEPLGSASIGQVLSASLHETISILCDIIRAGVRNLVMLGRATPHSEGIGDEEGCHQHLQSLDADPSVAGGSKGPPGAATRWNRGFDQILHTFSARVLSPSLLSPFLFLSSSADLINSILLAEFGPGRGQSAVSRF